MNQALVIRILTWFVSDVIAAMLVDENKRSVIGSFLLVHQQLYIAPLLSVSLEVGCKPSLHGHFRLHKDASFYERDM